MKRLAALAPWLAALMGLAFTLACFWPGYLSWDSAYQWWQARHAHFDPAHPPVMAGLWRAIARVWPGPGGYFLFQTVLAWSALAMFASALKLRPWVRGLVVLALGSWPPLFGLGAHLWKDVAMTAAFAWAVAFAAREVARPARAWRVLALLALALGCAYRYNAASAALPLALWLGAREWQAWRGKQATRAGRVGVGAAAFAAVVALSWLPAQLLRVPSVPVWPTIAQWDIAAVSVAEGRLLFPPHWSSPTLTVAELRAAYTPTTNTSLIDTGKIYLNFYTPMTPADLAALRRAWLSLPWSHARAYWRHRRRVAELLLGWDRAAHPDGLVFQPGAVPYRDNPPVTLNTWPLREPVQARLQAWVDSPLFAGWIYLVLAGALATLAAFDRRRPGAGLAVAVASSAVLCALPLVVLAPSTDFRYLGWLLLGVLMAPLAWACARR